MERDIAAKASENGLAELSDKTVATVLTKTGLTKTGLATTGVREHVPGNLGQSDRVIESPVRQRPNVGSDLGTVELKLEPTTKIEP